MKPNALLIASRRLFLASLVAATLVIAGCHSSSVPPPKPLSQLSPEQMQGRHVYVRYCSGCHYADSTASLHGPGLEGIFHRKYLPSGLPANNRNVTSVIEYGHNMMPPMGNDLNNQQIQELLAYLHTL